MATIEQRGPYQFRVKIRRQGANQAPTFESRREAEDWARILEGRITGGDFQDRREARDTTLSQACDWLLDRGVGPNADAKNVRSKLRYWKTSEFADWSLVSIHDWDLIEWRRRVLDEAGIDDEGGTGPG